MSRCAFNCPRTSNWHRSRRARRLSDWFPRKYPPRASRSECPNGGGPSSKDADVRQAAYCFESLVRMMRKLITTRRTMTELAAYCEDLGCRARAAGQLLATARGMDKD